MASVIRGSDGFDSGYSKPKTQCTAWVNFDGTTTPPTIRDSYNVASVVRTSTGVFDIYFATPMDNVNYSQVGTVSNSGVASSFSPIAILGDGRQLTKTFFVTTNGSANTSWVFNNIQIFGGKNV